MFHPRLPPRRREGFQFRAGYACHDPVIILSSALRRRTARTTRTSRTGCTGKNHPRGDAWESLDDEPDIPRRPGGGPRDEHVGLRPEGDPVVARHDGRQQRRRQQAGRGLQRFPEGLQGRRQLQGPVRRHHERRHRGLPRRQRPAHPAGLRGRHRHHDGRQGRDQAGRPADGGRGREVRPEKPTCRRSRAITRPPRARCCPSRSTRPRWSCGSTRTS